MDSLSCPDEGWEWTYTTEPSPVELAKIAHEEPVMRAEDQLLRAEIAFVAAPSAVTSRQIRRAVKAILKARATMRGVQVGCAGLARGGA